MPAPKRKQLIPAAFVTLGIETSCDETAAAVLQGERIRSNVVSSSVALHRAYGGIVPEIASRYHVEYISAVISEALTAAGRGIPDLSAIAVTSRPGLVGSLLVGLATAKAIHLASGVPLVAVDHVQAHLFSSVLAHRAVTFPFIGLVVSGGHTDLYLVADVCSVKRIGRTINDAAGEAYDKVAKLLGLGYPGGPAVSEAAETGDARAVTLPDIRVKGEAFDVSLSGIKTAVLYHVQRLCAAGRRLSIREIADLCASFQYRVCAGLVANALAACARYRIGTLCLGGGVVANRSLRRMMTDACAAQNVKLFLPPLELCTDNAAMIAYMGACLYQRGIVADEQVNASSLSEVSTG